jgi:hypothetical protein
LDLRGRKWQEAGEDCIMRSFVTCTLHKVLFRVILSHPFNAEVENAWSYTSTPQYVFMVWYLVKHRGT